MKTPAITAGVFLQKTRIKKGGGISFFTQMSVDIGRLNDTNIWSCSSQDAYILIHYLPFVKHFLIKNNLKGHIL